MKTITEHDGKNVNMQVVGDLHKYPDGSVHTVKNGKDVWEEGSGGDSGGSGGGVFIVELNLQTGALDKTAREIMDAMPNKSIVLHTELEGNMLYSLLSEFELMNGRYKFTFGMQRQFSCASENDYPFSNQE